METIICDNMLAFLLSHKLVSDSQFGFLARRSTCLQLVDCVDNWSSAVDNLDCIDIAYLDFAKAFNKVSHFKLMLKLAAYGISGCLLKWLSAFLSNRTQKVIVNRCSSSIANVSSGVPQGSVLGPLLFLIYINDITECTGGAQCRLFAVDIKVFVKFKKNSHVGSLQDCLNAIDLWSTVWQLPIAYNKCNILHMGFQNPSILYYLGNVHLTNVPCMGDLGVIISDSLVFHAYVNDIVAKAY